MDFNFFGTSGKKTYLHFLTVPSGKGEGSCSLLVSRAPRSKDTSLSSTGMRRSWSSSCTRKRTKNSRIQNAQRYGDFLCVKIPISLCVLDIVHGELNVGDHQV
ncbi:hypothetical protein CEXT_236711 [Caerostris extrusa]|uniref:Uncharacterized protein n=1 Tax=Caerostris extrusa TaxID=172846 RepID=A0AAV4Q251_CAEEX|nr:hypothetical protein CEXT_236711 [Caerostris extrusa]